MNLKKVSMSLITIAVFVVLLFTQGSVFATVTESPMYLGVTEVMTGTNMGYAIGDPGTNGTTGAGAKIWNIVKYSTGTSNDPTEINAFCVKAGVGFSDTNKRATYDVFYDMKTEREEIKNQNDILKELVEGTITEDGATISRYDALLAAIDMLYLPGVSSETEKDELLNNILDYAKQPTSGYTDYVELMEGYPLTDDDITAVQQAAIWYFTNYGEESGKYDKTDDTEWLNYTLDGASYNTLSSYNPNKENNVTPQNDAGQARSYQAEILYNYIIEQAKANASKYSTSSSTAEVPAKVNTTTLKYKESDDNYIVGPINITETEGNTIPYTVDFIVKNENTEVSNYTLLDKNQASVAEGTIVKDLVGEDFYISLPKSSVTELSIKININYKNTKMTLWTSNTDNQTQPVVIPERENKQISIELKLNPENPKSFDLALRKYITKVNGVELTGTSSRVPSIDESTLTSGTTATYKHRKDPVTIVTGDKVTYKLTIYNEGEKAGRATKIVDQLPTGLKFSKVISGNFELDTYSEDTNTLNLKRLASDTTNLSAYTAGNLESETIEIECEVTEKPDSKNNKILTNVAWISEAIDESNVVITNQEGADRDSEPATTPSVNKDSMENYKGNTSNKADLTDSKYYYKGEQDDDDFEKLVLLPESFDLKLIKRIVEVNGQNVPERIESVDVSKLNTLDENGNMVTTGDYDLNKDPVQVKKGDIVTYTFRIYNEGTIDGYVQEITEDIPEGLQFLWSEKEGEELENDTTLTSDEKEAVLFNQKYLWGNFVYDESKENIIQVSSDYLSKENETTVGGNLIPAFGKNDGTKTEDDISYKEISIKMKVISDNISGTVIRNEAAITDDADGDGNSIEDRDSTPEKWVKYEDDEDYDQIILKSFDLALRKFIMAVSDDTTIDNNEYLKNEDGSYTRAPSVDTSKLNTVDENGNVITTAIYNHTKEPVEVKKNDIVVYMLRVYNEGDIDGYAAEIKDHLPSYLEFVDGDYNKKYGWEVSEDGRTVTTRYLENTKISKATTDESGKIVLSYKEVPIMCKVKEDAKTCENITNIADITEYLDENKEPIEDRDSQENNVKLPEDKDLPGYKDDEKGEYIPGQQDDDDFEKVIIPRFDLALRKQITSIYNVNTQKETEYNDRYAKLDKTQNNTIYNYYDVESNIPTVVENDVVTYSIRIYNEGEVDGTATWVTDRLPSGLEYLPDNETNKKYGWKAFKESTADAEKAVKIGEKYYEEVSYDSKEIYLYATEYLKDTTIKAYNGEGEAAYAEVFMATRVKAKKEVEEGTEYKLRNVAEIGEDNGDDYDSTPGDESEWKEQDDVDIEELKLLEFDLALRKWVTQAIVIENGTQTVTETGHKPYDDPEQVVKVELHRKKLNEVVVKFKYSIRVINEGEIEGYAKEVTDYIPEGLKFLPEDNQGWTDEGNNVISTRLLENTLLKPGEYADVEVVLTWINSENNMGVMTNTAEISEDYNEYGVHDKDSTPDNKKEGEDDIDDAPVMISISTGQVRIYFALGFIVLITVAGGVVLIKKFVL